MQSQKVRQLDIIHPQGLQSRIHVVRPGTQKRAHSIKMVQVRSPLPPFSPPRAVESPKIRERSGSSLGSGSSQFESEGFGCIDFVFTNDVTSIFQLDLSIRDLYENMESITLFWQDKINKTEQDVKEEIQRMIFNHTQEIQDFDTNKNILQFETVPTLLQVLPSSDGTIKAIAVQSQPIHQKGNTKRKIRTGDQRLYEESKLQRSMIIDRQKTEIVKFNSDCKIMLNDIINQYLSTLNPLKSKLENLLDQYYSLQGLYHPLKFCC